MEFSEEFVNLCRKGDRRAEKELFQMLYTPMFRLVYRYVNHTEEAEDCVMRGFVKAFQNLEKFRWEHSRSLFFWIRRIMVNEALMGLRGRHNFNLVPVDEVYDAGFDAHILEKIEAEQLYGLIRQLPEGYRTVFNLFIIEGFSHDEIGQMLGISENTSKSQLSKARARLQEMILALNKKATEHVHRG